MKKLLSFIQSAFTGEEMTYQDVLKILFPVMIDQFFLVSFNFINTAMISSSGTAAISAVNMVGSLNNLFINLFVGVGLGGTVLISRAFGAKNQAQIKVNCKSTIQTAFLGGTFLSLVMFIFHTQILTLIFGGASLDVMKNAQIYFVGLLLSYPAESIVEGVNGSLRGVGRTRSSLKLSLLMNGLYILLNFFFISFLKLGILGLVYSLIISRILGAIAAMFMIHWQKLIFHLKMKDFLQIKGKEVGLVFTTSVPFASENAFFAGGKVIMQMMIVTLGTNMIAANAIGVSWIQMSEILATALSVTLVPVVGQSIGRKNISDAKKMAKAFVVAAAILIFLSDLILLLFFPLGMKLFNPPQEIIPTIFHIFIISMVLHPVWGPSFVLPSALRAAGDSIFTTVVSLLSMWLFRVGVGYLVGIHLGYGLVGIFFVMTLEWLLRGIIFTLRFKTNKWYQKTIPSKESLNS